MERFRFYPLFIAALFFIGCTSGSREGSESESIGGADTLTDEASVAEEQSYDAVVTLSGASGSTVTGSAMFTDLGNQTVRMNIDVQNLEEGEHALHLHQNGDCSAADATSAGGHWNPTNRPHGRRGEAEFHKGDIANLEVGSDGSVSWTQDISGWTIGGPDSTNIVSKAVIIHADADDFISQPAGNAGARVACGVIQAVAM